MIRPEVIPGMRCLFLANPPDPPGGTRREKGVTMKSPAARREPASRRRGRGDPPVPQNAAVLPPADSTESADRHAFEAALEASFPATKKPQEGEVVSGVIAGI